MKTFQYCPWCAAPLVEKQIEARPRLVCSASCAFVHYDNPIPVVAAVVEYQGAIVLAHNRSWPRPFYGLITGFLERDESPHQAVVREVKEELNLDVAASTDADADAAVRTGADGPTLIGVYEFTRMNQVIIGFHVKATGTIALNEELDDYRLVPPERCRYWPGGTGFTLRDWLRSRGYEPELLEATPK